MEEMEKSKKGEFNPEEVRAQIEQIREKELEDKTKPGGPGPWAGINPEHLEKSDLEIFDLFNKGDLEKIDDRIRLIREKIEEEENDSIKNSRLNFINMISQKADSEIAENKLKEEGEKL